jgi:hypothetical protein
VQYWPCQTVLWFLSKCSVLTISDSGVICVYMCSTDHFWQCCNIYRMFSTDHYWQWCEICRYVHYWSFGTVLCYLSICSSLTISDSAVKYIDTCTTDHLKPYFNIYRYLHYWPFRTTQFYSQNSEYFALNTAVSILLSVDVAWLRQRNSNLHTYCGR